MSFTRRQLLQASAVAGFGIVGLRKKSLAASGPARASRVLILNANGGLRTSAAFNASPLVDLNPWRVLGTFGSMRLGNVLVAAPNEVAFAAPSWPVTTVPGIAELAPRLAIIAAADHAPDRSRRAGDHTDDVPRMGTGYYSPSAPGVLTVLNRYLGEGKAAPVTILPGGTALPEAPGDWQQFAPTSLSFDELPDAPPPTGDPNIGAPIEAALDARHARKRRGLARAAYEVYAGAKRTMRAYGPLFAQPTLHVSRAANDGAAIGGITNGMLLEAVGVERGTSRPGDRNAYNVAIALRLLQMGSPAAVVSFGGFDRHSEELEQAPGLYTRFARAIAGVHFALENMPDPSGTGSMLDSTLVVTTSEFGRSAHSGGFNEGNGSDHGDDPSWRNQAHLFFGAGVKPKILSETDDDNAPRSGVTSTHAILATICCAAGVPEVEIEKLWPAGSPLYPEGRPLWALWE